VTEYAQRILNTACASSRWGSVTTGHISSKKRLDVATSSRSPFMAIRATAHTTMPSSLGLVKQSRASITAATSPRMRPDEP
jgi:hypothetical protein